MKKATIVLMIQTIVAIILSTYWTFNSDYVRSNEYILGVFRGVIYTSIISNYLLMLLPSNKTNHD